MLKEGIEVAKAANALANNDNLRNVSSKLFPFFGLKKGCRCLCKRNY